MNAKPAAKVRQNGEPTVSGGDAALMRELVRLQRELLIEVRGLRSDMRRDTVLSGDEMAACLMREIFAAFGTKAVMTSEIVGAAAVRPGLRKAIEAFCPVDPRRLGKVLQRYKGIEAGGHLLIKAGDSNLGAVWVVKVMKVMTTSITTKSIAERPPAGIAQLQQGQTRR